jgi:hydroxyacylglutathione hydrolase
MRATPFGENWLPIEDARSPLAAVTRESDTLLLDLRSPAVFASGFIPGSFHLPDVGCLELLRTNGLLQRKKIFFVADDPDAIARGRESLASLNLEFGGGCGTDLIERWRKHHGDLASLEVIEAGTLAVRVSAWKTLVFDMRSPAAFERMRIPEALHIPPDNFALSLAGLPAETAVCVVCEAGDRASFAASVVWNLGFRKVAFLKGGFAAYLENRLPLFRGSR